MGARDLGGAAQVVASSVPPRVGCGRVDQIRYVVETAVVHVRAADLTQARTRSMNCLIVIC